LILENDVAVLGDKVVLAVVFVQWVDSFNREIDWDYCSYACCKTALYQLHRQEKEDFQLEHL
jgi:hypothetical protein